MRLALNSRLPAARPPFDRPAARSLLPVLQARQMVQRGTTLRQPTAAAASTTLSEVLDSHTDSLLEPIPFSLDSSSMGAAYQTRALTRSYPFLSAITHTTITEPGNRQSDSLLHD